MLLYRRGQFGFWRLLESPQMRMRNLSLLSKELFAKRIFCLSLKKSGMCLSRPMSPYCHLFSRVGSPHVRHLRQSLTLTGFNTSTFQSVSENIATVHELFGHFIGKDSLQPLTYISGFGEYVSINMANRYFTPRWAETLGATEIPFSTNVDPHGFLGKAAGSGLFHSDKNVVHCYERVFKDK